MGRASTLGRHPFSLLLLTSAAAAALHPVAQEPDYPEPEWKALRDLGQVREPALQALDVEARSGPGPGGSVHPDPEDGVGPGKD